MTLARRQQISRQNDLVARIMHADCSNHPPQPSSSSLAAAAANDAVSRH